MGKGSEKPKRKTRCDKDWEWKRPPPLYEAAQIEPTNTARRKMKEVLADPECNFNDAIQYAVARGNVNAVELMMAAAADRDVSAYKYEPPMQEDLFYVAKSVPEEDDGKSKKKK